MIHFTSKRDLVSANLHLQKLASSISWLLLWRTNLLGWHAVFHRSSFFFSSYQDTLIYVYVHSGWFLPSFPACCSVGSQGSLEKGFITWFVVQSIDPALFESPDSCLLLTCSLPCFKVNCCIILRWYKVKKESMLSRKTSLTTISISPLTGCTEKVTTQCLWHLSYLTSSVSSWVFSYL